MSNKYWYAEMLYAEGQARRGHSAESYGGPSPDRYEYVRDLEEMDRYDDEGWSWLDDED